MNLNAIALELWENSATYPEIRSALAQVRDEANADLLEENAKLKKHAEAMWNAVIGSRERWTQGPTVSVCGPRTAFDAYRADFPKGTT